MMSDEPSPVLPAASESPQQCPHCGGALHLHLVGKAIPNQTIVFTTKPGSRGVLLARNYGQLIDQMAKFVEALSREVGLNERAFISGLALQKDGSAKVSMTLCKMQPAKGKSKSGDGSTLKPVGEPKTEEGEG